MGKFVDLTGNRYGRLTVIERAGNQVHPKGGRQIMWKCICDCGKEHLAVGGHLKLGRIRSCGCIRREMIKRCNNKKKTTHGCTGTRLYRIWQGMKNRCYLPSHKSYHNYGGRGITICDEWLHDFQAFYDWAMANGYREDLSIDRIDVNGNYCPENCRWATPKEQARNQTTNRYITINGETMIAADWYQKYGVKKRDFYNRLKAGWSPEEALGIVPREKE